MVPASVNTDWSDSVQAVLKPVESTNTMMAKIASAKKDMLDLEESVNLVQSEQLQMLTKLLVFV